jgi:hypothetical protein
VDTLGAYASDDGRPHVRISVVALFDMLGFTENIRRAFAQKRSDELLQNFRTSVNNWYPVVKDVLSSEDGTPRLWETRAFSDNVAIGQPIRWGGEPELGYMMADLAFLQLGLVHDGYFLRGGIAVGELYMDEDLVFGVGILDAHDAELVARVPRVVLHQSAVDLIREQVKYYSSVAGAPHNDAVLVDEDEQFFLNYLDAFWPDKTEYADYSAVQKHSEIVRMRLNEFANESRYRAKYEWVARYHNYFCQATYGAHSYRIDGYGALAARRLDELE